MGGAPPLATPVAVPGDVDPVEQEVRHVERAMRTDHADRNHLVAAREAAKEHMSDARALKSWATAAYESGHPREARHAAEAWALHDDSPEPRIFLAKVLEAGGHHADAQAVLELTPTDPSKKSAV